MRQSVVGSTLVHVALLVAIFAVRVNARLIVPGPDVVQVALIEPGMMQEPPPSPPQPQPKPVPQQITPEHDVGVKVSPPPKKKRVETPVDPKIEPPPAPILPMARVGPSGLRGSMAVEGGDFEFTYYLVIVRNRIAQNWTPPAGLVTGGKPVQGLVYFRINRGGALSEVKLETGSGYEFFDRSALRAIQLSDPMPPLPLGFPGSDLGVHFGFEYVSP